MSQARLNSQSLLSTSSMWGGGERRGANKINKYIFINICFRFKSSPLGRLQILIRHKPSSPALSAKQPPSNGRGHRSDLPPSRRRPAPDLLLSLPPPNHRLPICRQVLLPATHLPFLRPPPVYPVRLSSAPPHRPPAASSPSSPPASQPVLVPPATIVLGPPCFRPQRGTMASIQLRVPPF